MEESEDLERVAKKENQMGAGNRTGRDLQTAASDLELNFFHLSGAHGTGEPKVKATARQDKRAARSFLVPSSASE